MELWRSKGLTNQAVELHWQLLSILVHVKDHGLARVAHLDVVVACLFLDAEQHVLKRDVLHAHTPPVKVSKAFGGLADQVLCVRLVETCRFLFQRLQKITSLGQLKDDVEAVLIIKVFLRVHHVLTSLHVLRKPNLVERNLTELDGTRFLCLGKLTLVQHLDCEILSG